MVPASVTVPAGATTATFAIATPTVAATTNATLTASYAAVIRIAVLAVNPAPVVATLASVTLSPTSVVGGNGPDRHGDALLGCAAVAPSSPSRAAARPRVVPASVTVPAGATTATFAIATPTVAATTSATITAPCCCVIRTAILTVNPAPVVADARLGDLEPHQRRRRHRGPTGTVTLSSSAPAGGAIVALSSSSAPPATVPASVTVPAGATTATFAVATTVRTSNTASDDHGIPFRNDPDGPADRAPDRGAVAGARIAPAWREAPRPSAPSQSTSRLRRRDSASRSPAA